MDFQKRSLAALVAVGFPTAAIAQQETGWSRGFGSMMWGNGYGMFGGIMMVLFWGAIIAVIFVLVRFFSRSGGGSNSTLPDPQDTLKDRFARGEIDEEEYQRRKIVLDE